MVLTLHDLPCPVFRLRRAILSSPEKATLHYFQMSYLALSSIELPFSVPRQAICPVPRRTTLPCLYACFLVLSLGEVSCPVLKRTTLSCSQNITLFLNKLPRPVPQSSYLVLPLNKLPCPVPTRPTLSCLPSSRGKRVK